MGIHYKTDGARANSATAAPECFTAHRRPTCVEDGTPALTIREVVATMRVSRVGANHFTFKVLEDYARIDREAPFACRAVTRAPP